MSEAADEATGIAKRVVIDWRTSTPGGRPASRRSSIKGKDGKVQQARARRRSPLPAAGRRHPVGRSGAKVKAGDVLARIPTESAKTRDITGGLPRVAELFEARRPKDHAIIAEIAGTVQFGKRLQEQAPHQHRAGREGRASRSEYLIPKGKHIHLQDGDAIEKGDYIVDGNPAPHDILAIKGVEELADYLVNEIQEVYRLQGVPINDKHIEVIVRQMLQKVEIDDVGETDMLQGEQIDKLEFDEINAKSWPRARSPRPRSRSCSASPRRACRPARSSRRRRSRRPPACSPRPRSTARSTRSKGLKENVIVGRLIPAGTGAMMNRLREVAVKRDAAHPRGAREGSRRRRRRRPRRRRSRQGGRSRRALPAAE